VSTTTEITVYIGDVKLGQPQTRLSAILGSCVGIALIDRRFGACTLSHSLLPFSSNSDPARRGRWVNQAVEAAIELLNVPPGRTRSVQAVVAGGGCMINSLSKRKIEIGQANIKAAVEALDALKIPVIAQDVGGTHGRRISICADSLDHEILRIPRSEPAEVTL